MLELRRQNDTIGLDQLLRRERGVFERAVNGVTDDHINHHDDEATVRDAGGRLALAAERRLASLTPLGLHKPGGIRSELRAHAGWMSRSQLRGGGMMWQEAWRWPWGIVGMSLGSVLCRLERYEPIGELLGATWLNRYNEAEGFIGHPGEVADAVGRILGPAPPEGRTWAMSAWSWLVEEVRGYAWLAERYPEWLADQRDPAASLAEFDMLDGLAEGFRSGHQVLALWSLQPDSASAFARRLYGDRHVRAEVAAAVGVDLTTFDARAPEMLANAQGIGMFPRTREVGNILRTGNFR